MNSGIAMLAAVLACSVLVPPAFAADPDPPVAPDPLSVARQRLAEKSWPAAIDELKRLAALDKVCFFPCEEYTDLARYKAAGNKYVAAP